MRGDVDKIKQVLPENCTVDEAVKFLLDTKLISHTGPRDAEIYMKWQENTKERGRFRGTIATSCQTGVSDRTVYRVIDRFERD